MQKSNLTVGLEEAIEVLGGVAWPQTHDGEQPCTPLWATQIRFLP